MDFNKQFSQKEFDKHGNSCWDVGFASGIAFVCLILLVGYLLA